jgi:hypothetical protein
LFSGLVDYTLAKFLYEETKEGYRKFFLILSVIFNLSFLGYFKYSNFLIDQTRKQQQTKIDSAGFIIKEQREGKNINVSVDSSFGFGRKNVNGVEQ